MTNGSDQQEGISKEDRGRRTGQTQIGGIVGHGQGRGQEAPVAAEIEMAGKAPERR